MTKNKSHEEIASGLFETTDLKEQQQILDQLPIEFVFKQFYGVDYQTEKERGKKEVNLLKTLIQAGMTFEEALECLNNPFYNEKNND